MNTSVPMPLEPSADGSTIHDLGYRRYEGAREGAAGAFRALFWQGFRSLFGLGRPAKAKAIPVFVMVVSMLPTLGMLAAASAAPGQVPLRNGPMLESRLILLVLFVAAQAPELLSRDQQYRVLPLILTRDVTRWRYALARWLSIFAGMWVLSMVPLLLLYIGEIGVDKVPADAFRRMGDHIWPVLLHGTLTAWVLGGIGAGLASLTPRRAYASASIIGLMLVLTAVTAGMNELAGVSEPVAALLDPVRALHTTALLLFDEKTRGMELTPPPALAVYLTVLTAVGLAGAVLLFWRMRKVDP
jgi:ABC-2 type transport system permease protein